MHAIALVERVEHVCVRYRLAPFRAPLTAAGHRLDLEPFAPSLVGRLRQYQTFTEYDAVILQRTLLSRFEMHYLRRHARRLIFDFDDAVWQRDSYSPNGTVSRKRARRFEHTMQLADTVIAGNDFLAARAKHPRVAVVPSCVGLIGPPRRHECGEALTLVWVGSSSTLRSLESIRPTLEALGREFPSLHLKLICDRTDIFQPLKVDFIRWNAVTEAEQIASGDVGIAWMADDDWSRGKCGVKVLQYLAAGLPVIANPVGVHRDMVRPGKTGVLADRTDAWLAAVRHLHDPALRQALGGNGRRLVEAQYSLARGTAAWINLFNSFPMRAAC